MRAEALALDYAPDGEAEPEIAALIDALDAATGDADLEADLGAADAATGLCEPRLWDCDGAGSMAGWSLEYREKWDQSRWACGDPAGAERSGDELEPDHRDCPAAPDRLRLTAREKRALKIPGGRANPVKRHKPHALSGNVVSLAAFKAKARGLFRLVQWREPGGIWALVRVIQPDGSWHNAHGPLSEMQGLCRAYEARGFVIETHEVRS